MTLEVQLQQDSPIPLDIDFACEKGELLALAGPSGSGKTTVLRAIAGLQPVASGVIACDGTTWLDTEQKVNRTPQQRKIGFVFQQYALFPHLSVLQNVMVAMGNGSRAVKRAQKRERATELLELTNMGGLQARYPAQLSGGQRQRVALARALARDPQVLLLDEPFSAVDQQTRQRLFRELAQLRKNLNLPVILVTHDMSEVNQLADTISLVRRGRTVQSGSLQGVVQHPVSVSAAKLLGHQNLYQVTVLEKSPEGAVADLCGTTLHTSSSQFPEGSQVIAMIPQSAIIMHRRDRPSRGERENPLTGTVVEAVVLGDDLSVKLRLDASSESLVFRLSQHVAARNRVEPGETVTVSVLHEGIHLISKPDNWVDRSARH